jgi:hypothetical protein
MSKEALALKEKHRAQKQLERLAYSNWGRHKEKPKLFTFTHADNWNIEQANPYFNNFIKRMEYAFKRDIKYIAVPEKQKRGSIHYHVIFFNIPFTPRVNSVVRRLWGPYQIHRSRGGGDPILAIRYISKYLGKTFSDTSMVGRKKFYTSHNLIRPYILDGDVSGEYDASIEMLLNSYFLSTITPHTVHYSLPYTDTEVDKSTYLVEVHNWLSFDDRVKEIVKGLTLVSTR